MNSVIEEKVGNDSLAPLGGGEQTLLLLLASRLASNIRTREDAAIEAEDILTQAEEALTL